MNKKIQKETTISTDIDTYKQNKYRIDSEIEDDDTLKLTSANEGEVSEVLKLPPSDILRDLGINLEGKSPNERISIIKFLKDMMGQLRDKFGVGALIGEDEDKDTSEIDSLYSGADDRAVEYGVQSEDFDSIMEDLDKKGGPTVDIQENVNPRISKQALIDYLNKKDYKI